MIHYQQTNDCADNHSLALPIEERSVHGVVVGGGSGLPSAHSDIRAHGPLHNNHGHSARLFVDLYSLARVIVLHAEGH
jgi:hypothetical protein